MAHRLLILSAVVVQIGYVGQEPVLFQGTIRENIAKGDPDASEERIQDAAKATNAHDFVMKFEVKTGKYRGSVVSC